MNSFKIMTKYSWLDEPEITAIGYILDNGKIRVTYDPINVGIPDDTYNTYNELIDFIPDECYIVFDNQ
jgi:hypothetical protein